MAAYYYTPLYDGPYPDPETGDPMPGTATKEPGQDTGSGAEYLGSQPSGLTVLLYDDANTRCVVKLAVNPTIPSGWLLKTAGEVQADYPGLQGVE